MPRLATFALLAGLPVTALCGPVLAQTTTANSTGSAGCAAVVQAAADGMNNRIAADDQRINAPLSVTKLSCLSGFFNGLGLDVVTNLLNPQTLINAVEGQICQAVQSTWTSLTGGAQCGLTLTGFNFGFGGLGGGLSCPKLSFGGGGPPIGSVGIGNGTSGSGLYISGHGLPPTGYTLPLNLQPGTF